MVEHRHFYNVSQFGGTQWFLKLFSIWWNTVILNFPQFGGTIISKLFSTWCYTGISKCCVTQSFLNCSQFGGTQSFWNYSQFGGAMSFLNYSQFDGAPSFLKCFPIWWNTVIFKTFLNLVEHGHFKLSSVWWRSHFKLSSSWWSSYF